MVRLCLLCLCGIFFAMCFIPFPALGTPPFDSLQCTDDFVWNSETFNLGGVDQYSVWYTFLSDKTGLDIVQDSKGIKSVTITFQDGRKAIGSITPPSTDIIVNIYDKDGKLIDTETYTGITWEKLLDTIICEQEFKYVRDLLKTWKIDNPGGGGSPGGLGQNVIPAPSIGGVSRSVYPPTLDDLPCSLTWTLEWIRDTGGQYATWTTTLSDGSKAVVVTGPKGVKGITITEPNGTRITLLLEFDNSVYVNIYKDRSYTNFRTSVPLSYLIEELLCTRNGQNIVDQWYEFLHIGVRTTFGNGDLVDVPMGDKTTTLTVLDDTGPNPHRNLISGGTGNDCEKSDLVIKQLSVPDLGTAGSTLSLSVTIKNTGSLPSGESAIKIHLSQGGEEILSPVLISPLQPGEEKLFAVPIPIPDNTKGPGILTVVLDPDNTEDECNEYNNEDSTNIRILPAGVTADDFTRLTAPPVHAVTSGSGGSGGGGGGKDPTGDT